MTTERPYKDTYTKITDIDKYFKYDDKNKEMIFMGDELKIYIWQRFEVYQLLQISDTVQTIGIFDMVFDDTYRAGMNMLAMIEIDPDDSTIVNVQDSGSYVVLTLHKGSRFICRTDIVRNTNLIYSVFVEFITRGKWPYIFDYNNIAALFDNAAKLCDAKLPIDHAILELIYSHLARDSKNISIQYRHTDMTEPFEMIPLRSVGYAPTGNASRILGSYFGDALNAALVNPNTDQPHIYEQLLR